MIPTARRKRRTRDFRPRTSQLPLDIVVLSATRTGATTIDFAFSQPVTSIGGAGNGQIVIETAPGSGETPSSATQINPTTVRFHFDPGPVGIGNPWEILVEPSDLDFHGLTFVIPQTGLVVG